MRITIKVALICSLIFIIIKTSFHLFFPNEIQLNFLILSNIFFLMGSISVGLYLHKKKEGFNLGNTLTDIKAAMTAGICYAFFIAIFLFLYYQYINPTFVENSRAPLYEQLSDEISTDDKLNKLKKLNPELETKSREEIYKMGADNIEFKSSPKFTAILSMLSMTLLATLYSILITLIYRKILSKGVRN